MYSGPLYKSCQPCPWCPYGPCPGGVMGKTLKNLLLGNHKAQSFHILFLAMYSGPLYKSCQLCSWGPYGPRPGGVMGKKNKKIFFSETIWPRAFICCVDQCMILSFINAANGCPWGPYRPHPRHVIIYHRLIMEIYEKNLLCNSMTQSLYI